MFDNKARCWRRANQDDLVEGTVLWFFNPDIRVRIISRAGENGFVGEILHENSNRTGIRTGGSIEKAFVEVEK